MLNPLKKLGILIAAIACILLCGCSNNAVLDENSVDYESVYFETTQKYEQIIESLLSNNLESDINQGKFPAPNTEQGYHWDAMLAEIQEGLPAVSKESFKYSLRDISSDGVPELIWYRTDGVILAIFSVYDNNVYLLDAYWPKHKCVLTEENELYVLSAGSAQDLEYTVQTVDNTNHKLKTIEHFGINNGDYFNCIDNEVVQIDEKTFNDMLTEWKQGYENRSVILSEHNSGEQMPFSVKKTDKGYVYQIYNNNVLVEEACLAKEPKYHFVTETLLYVTVQTGTGKSTNWGFFYDYAADRRSETFYWVLDYTETKVITGRPDKVVIQSIFNRDYIEITDFEQPLAQVADAILSADFSEDMTTVTATYVVEGSYDTAIQTFFMDKYVEVTENSFALDE